MALVTMTLALLGTIAGSASAAPTREITVDASAVPATIVEGDHVNFSLGWNWPNGVPTGTHMSASLTAVSGDTPAPWPNRLEAASVTGTCHVDHVGGSYVVSFDVAPGPSDHDCEVMLTAADHPGPDDDQEVNLRAGTTDVDASIAPGTDDITFDVLDDDLLFGFGTLPPTVDEGEPFSVPFSRVGAMSLAPTIEYSVAYTGKSAQDGLTQSVAAQADHGLLSIPNPQDDTYDPNGRRVLITITEHGPGSPADILVKDDDSIVHMATTEVAARRTDGFATVQLSREGDRRAGVDVDYKIVEGTAQSGRDYVSSETGSTHFDPDQATAKIMVPLTAIDAPDARRFTVALLPSPRQNLGRGVTSPAAPLAATVTIAATSSKPEDPKTPEEPKGPEDPPHVKPLITAQIKLRTKAGKGGAEYVALPKAKTKVYVSVKLKTDKALAAGTKIRLAGKGLAFGGGKSAQSVVTVASPIPADGALHDGATLAAHTTSKDRVKVTPQAVDDAISVAGAELSLKAPTSAVLLKLPEPVRRSKNHDKDLVTWFNGTYSAPTCGAKLSVLYYVQGAWHDAQVPLKSSTVNGICQFAGKIRWEPGILNYAHIKVRVKLGKRLSKPATLKIKRNR